jgi:hypothetical protein
MSDIKQNLCSDDFEDDKLNKSGGMGHKREPIGHCNKVCKIRAEYESNVSTERGLIELGKHIAGIEIAKQKRAVRYKYLTASVNELNSFNGDTFLREIQECKNKKVIIGKVSSILRYIPMFKDLYDHHMEDLSDLNKEIEILRVDNGDKDEMMNNYIQDIEIAEEKLNNLVGYVRKYKTLFVQYDKKHAENCQLLEACDSTINQLHIDRWMYADNCKIHEIENDEWNTQKIALDEIICKQSGVIAQLKEDIVCNQTSLYQYFILGVSCSIIVWMTYNGYNIMNKI